MIPLPAVGQAPVAARPAGTAGSRTADWEFALQNGRMPAGEAERKEFGRFLCRQLEATLINIMMQVARKSSPAAGLLSGGFAGSMYRGLADEEFARAAAASGGFGLGDSLYEQMAAKLAGPRAYGRAGGAAAGAQETAGKSDN